MILTGLHFLASGVHNNPRTRIGKTAGVVVRPAAGDDDGNWAIAHDLRRSCAERLVATGIPEREVARVLRHASVETTRKHYAPGNVQESAGIIRRRLAAARSSSLLSP